MRNRYNLQISSLTCGINSVKISVNMLLICGIYCVFYVQVPLGILKKCETNHDDMIFILDHLHKYVPITSTTDMVMDPHIGSQIPVEKIYFSPYFVRRRYVNYQNGTNSSLYL